MGHSEFTPKPMANSVVTCSSILLAAFVKLTKLTLVEGVGLSSVRVMKLTKLTTVEGNVVLLALFRQLTGIYEKVPLRFTKFSR